MENPNDFVITRKRKLYRFALFRNSPLCFEFEQWDGQSAADIVEIGAGTGLFALSLAEKYPGRQVVAVDVKGDRLQVGARQAEEKGLTNIRFLRARADQLVEIFRPNSVMNIWLTFSDPFPKRRSAGRRLTHPTFLALYRTLLSTDGSLLIKHDNPAFFQWTLEQLVVEHWQLSQLSFDLHESDLPAEYKTMTTYEQRWTNEGRVTQFVAAQKAN